MTDQNKPPQNNRVLAASMVGGALAFIALIAFSAFKPPALEIANDLPLQAALRQAAMEIAQETAGLNSAGDSVYASAYINDATGVVTTPNDAGVYTAIAAAPLTAGETDGSGCITFTAASGAFTVAKRCGVGELLLTACIADHASSSNTAGVTTGTWYDGSTAIAAAPIVRDIQAVDAGGTRDVLGCSSVIYDAELSDVLTFRLTNAGGGVTSTTRGAHFQVTKLLSK